MGSTLWAVEPTAAWISMQWRMRLAREATNGLSGVSMNRALVRFAAAPR
jgi:hypothetical protein